MSSSRRLSVLVLFCALLLTSLAGVSTAKTIGPEGSYQDGELLVGFKTGVSDSGKARFHARHGSSAIREWRTLRLQHVKIKKGLSVAEAVDLYAADADVENVEPNYYREALGIPNDPQFNNQWSLNNTSYADVNAPEAWDYTTGSSDVVVAVIDSGVDYNHEDLAVNVWANPGETGLDGQGADKSTNGVDDDGNGYIDDVHGINAIANNGNPMDDNSHGTHVAGIIGAVGDNGVGVAGMNWDIKMMACKFLPNIGKGTDADVIECLQYIRAMKNAGVNIVATNNSWGGSSYSTAVANAIAAQGDILFVVAAGNEARHPSFPAAILYPYLPHKIGVAATDYYGNLSGYSNYDPRVIHLGAPGDSIRSTLPGNIYDGMSGTSMAAPHVAGLAALLKAQNPSRNYLQIKNLIMSGADATLSLAGKTLDGRRMNAHGSLGCDDYQRSLFAITTSPEYDNQPSYTLAVQSITCGDPVGPVLVTTSSGDALTLLDNGVAPDVLAGDGIFSGTWITNASSVRFDFTSPAGSTWVRYPVLRVASDPVPSAGLYMDYAHTLSTFSGAAPFSWALLSGELPPGLTLSGTGEIHGFPLVLGTYGFTVQVTDAEGSVASATLSLAVFPRAFDEVWRQTDSLDSGGNGDLALDAQGNMYMVGTVNGVGRIRRQDPATGNIVWERTAGLYGSGIAVDDAGDVISTGRLDNLTRPWLTVKRDQDGDELWAATLVNAAYNMGDDVATDGQNNVYVSGTFAGSVTWNHRDFMTAKYDPLGNELWRRTFLVTPSYDYISSRVAADRSGNVYVMGYLPGSYRLFKYDTDGNLLWQQSPDAGTYFEGQCLALDAEDNVYVSASVFAASAWSFATVKHDPDGTVLWTRNNPVAFVPRSLVITGDGSFFYGGYWTGAPSLYVYDSAGTMLWGGFFANFDQASAIAVRGNDLYATGATNNVSHPITAAYRAHVGVVTADLPPGYAGLTYEKTLAAEWGMPPYNWSILDGTLPQGLSFDPLTAILSGVPAGVGQYAFTILVTDGAGRQAIRPLALTIYNPLDIVPDTAPAGMAGHPYLLDLEPQGGQAPYSWRVAAGNLPDGLDLDTATGVISGIPVAPGSYSFSIQVDDINGTTFTRPYDVVVAETLAVATPAVLPYGLAQTAYTAALGATGGNAPYTWVLEGGSVPDNFSLQQVQNEWTIAASPYSTGIFTFTLRVTDTNSFSTTREFSLTIYEQLRVTSSAQLPQGMPDASYRCDLLAGGGLPPYTWTMTGGNLPPGLDFDAGTATVTGFPTTLGTWSFSVQVTDALGLTAAATLAITVSSFTYETSWVAHHDDPSSTMETAYGIAADVQGNVFVTGFSSSNFSHPRGWTVKYGPAGNKLWERAPGNPDGEENMDVTVDAAGNVYVTGTAYSGYLPRAIVYKYDTDGNLIWSCIVTPVNQDHPYGIALDREGNILITGQGYTNTQIGFTAKVNPAGSVLWKRNYSISNYPGFEAVAADWAGNAYVTGRYYSPSKKTQMLTLKYDPAGTLLWSKVYDGANYSWGTDLLVRPDGNVSVAMRVDYGFSGFPVVTYDPAGNLVATASVGTVPATATGIAMDAAGHLFLHGGATGGYYTAGADPDGTVFWSAANSEGTSPTEVAVTPDGGTVAVTGSSSYNLGMAYRDLTIVYRRHVQVAQSPLPLGTTSSAYSHQLQADWGRAPFTWSLLAGELPPGLTLNGQTGMISGAPSQPGTFAFTVTVTDSGLSAYRKNLAITVYDPLAIAVTALPPETVGRPYSQTLTATGGLPPYTWSVASGSLPPGLSLDAVAGMISGTPTAAGSYSFVARVADALPQTAEMPLAIVIAPANQPPVANAGADQTGPAGQALSFSGSASSDPDGTITSYSWNWGDDTADGAGVNATHTFATVGVKTITLTVTDNAGATATDTAVVTVNPPVNLALNKPASASSTRKGSSYTPAMAVDGNTATSWMSSTTSSAQWVRVDLGSSMSISNVRVFWPATYYAKAFQIETSTDGSAWTQKYTATSANGTVTSAVFAAINARYVRVYCTTRNNSSYYAVAELEVYAVPPPNQAPVANAGPDQIGTVGQVLSFSGSASSDVDGSIASYSWNWGDGTANGTGVSATHAYATTGSKTVTLTITDNAGATASDTAAVTVNPAPVNLALNRPASASTTRSGSSYTAAMALDGSMSTSWMSSTTSGDQWVRVDLGSSMSVSNVKVSWPATYYAKAFLIETSTDGTTWTQRYSTSSGNGTVTNAVFTAVNARYVRVYCTTRNKSSYYGVAELEVYQ